MSDESHNVLSRDEKAHLLETIGALWEVLQEHEDEIKLLKSKLDTK